ncbi:MAG: hypothetical protein H6617_10605 [Bdellovibrionaceae bacterium]|nr:hypothetical protein [Bdellovibrionales bacterium]MCB9255121.1 hypothetical protein [Pseudobdellovibrionaceae bacterium]
MKLLLIVCLLPTVVLAEVEKVSPLRDQTPPSVDRSHTLTPSRAPESSATPTTQFTKEEFERCLRQSHFAWLDEDSEGTFVVQGPKTDGKNSDFYLVYTKSGAYRLNMKDVAKERPLTLKLKAGSVVKLVSLAEKKMDGSIADSNALFAEADQEKANGASEVVLEALDWNREVEAFLLLATTEYFRSSLSESIRSASAKVYKARGESVESTLVGSIQRAKTAMDEASAALEQLADDLKQEKVDAKSYESKRELLRNEHKFWMEAWGALSNRKYHTDANKFTEAERRVAIEDLESQIRLGYLLKGFPACKDILAPALSFLFPADEKNHLGDFLKQRFLEKK